MSKIIPIFPGVVTDSPELMKASVRDQLCDLIEQLDTTDLDQATDAWHLQTYRRYAEIGFALASLSGDPQSTKTQEVS